MWGVWTPGGMGVVMEHKGRKGEFVVLLHRLRQGWWTRCANSVNLARTKTKQSQLAVVFWYELFCIYDTYYKHSFLNWRLFTESVTHPLKKQFRNFGKIRARLPYFNWPFKNVLATGIGLTRILVLA